MSKITHWRNRLPHQFDDFDEFFPSSANAFTPAVNVYQTVNAVVVETSLPGVLPEDTKIELSNDVLSISGSTERKTEVDEKEYYRREVRSGSFQRVIPVPVPVDGDAAEATYDRGVLVVTLPKLAPQKESTRQIKIS